MLVLIIHHLNVVVFSFLLYTTMMEILCHHLEDEDVIKTIITSKYLTISVPQYIMFEGFQTFQMAKLSSTNN